MALLDLFSKRQKRARGELPDVYVYDALPTALRVQIVHIIRDAMGSDSYSGDNRSGRAYHALHEMLAREFGVFQLSNKSDQKENLYDFILKEANVERVMDAVELSCRFIEAYGNDSSFVYHAKPRQTPGDAIAELNGRFREHGIGYQFDAGTILRTDSQYVHAEVVKPALGVLSGKQFAGAQKEFLNAHEHYRRGKAEEAITESLKAFESALKSICAKRGWTYRETDTAKQLLEVCIKEGLIPSSLQSEFTALRSVLESGVPTIRNKQAGHGTGPTPRVVPDHLAGYALHLTAASIVFLAAAEDAL
jgi:hypothetical protein